MTTLDTFMLGFVVLVAVAFLGWFVYELRSEDKE